MRNPIRNTDLNRLVRVLDGYTAGHFTLPGAVVRAETALRNLQAVEVNIPDADAAFFEVVDATLAAAADGKRLPPVTSLLKTRAAAAEATAHRDVLIRCLTSAEDQLVQSIRSNADAIITKHLAPVIAEIMAEAAEAARNAEGDGDRVTLLHGSQANVAAWRTLEVLAERYRAVREVRRVLATGVKHDDPALFTELRAGLRAVWPRAGTATAGPAPWPDAPSARLRWLATCGHEVWLPTEAQRDQAWLAAYGDDAQQAQAKRLVG